MAKRRQRGRGAGSVYKRKGREPYYISYRGHDGERHIECSGTRDKATADRILAKILADVALRRRGILDPRREAMADHSRRPLREHLAEYQAMMEARQRSANHIRRTLMYIREICDAACIGSITQIGADAVNRIIAELQESGWAPRTIQGRVVAIKGFTKWLADHAKLSHDPLRSIKRPSVKTGRKLVRRMLLPDEWPYLHAATMAGGQRNGMMPRERMALYMLAIQTGLRASEIESLTKIDLRLAENKPYVRCRAENTKNKQEARQYIDGGLAAELRVLTATKMPGVPVFSIQASCDLAEALREDLANARKAWLSENKAQRLEREESDFLLPINHAGESLDFHALRHSCGAWLALQGAHPKTIQTVMRHSSITLTMDTYGHLLPDQHADAIAGMASMFRGNMNRRKAR